MDGLEEIRGNNQGFKHGTFESATTGGCKCDRCSIITEQYCNPNGVPMCVRLPNHNGRCSIRNTDRALDHLERELFGLNFSSMHRTYIRDIVRSYQS